MPDSAHGGTLSSSSDFEFSITLSPSSKHSAPHLCPADELFYKGQLLPLHLSPRLSLVRTLLLSSPSTSSSEATSSTTPSRDSNGSSSSADYSDSSRPSSATEEEDLAASANSKRRYFSSFATRFSSFFRGNKKDPASAKKMIRRYAEKVKPLYEKLASLQKRKTFCLRRTEILSSSHAHSQSLNNGSMYRLKSAASCPSSMRSSPSHSGLLRSDLPSSSSMEELQGAIQAAIAHCKSTMAKQKKDAH